GRCGLPTGCAGAPRRCRRRWTASRYGRWPPSPGCPRRWSPTWGGTVEHESRRAARRRNRHRPDGGPVSILLQDTERGAAMRRVHWLVLIVAVVLAGLVAGRVTPPRADPPPAPPPPPPL